MSMELSNNVVRKTLTLNLSRAQRCNKKGTHPRPDRTESPVTDAWSGLSRRIFPGIQAQCGQGELESISPAFSRFHRDLKSIDFQPSPINTLPQKSNQDKNTTDVHFYKWNSKNILPSRGCVIDREFHQLVAGDLLSRKLEIKKRGVNTCR